MSSSYPQQQIKNHPRLQKTTTQNFGNKQEKKGSLSSLHEEPISTFSASQDTHDRGTHTHREDGPYFSSMLIKYRICSSRRDSSVFSLFFRHSDKVLVLHRPKPHYCGAQDKEKAGSE